MILAELVEAYWTTMIMTITIICTGAGMITEKIFIRLPLLVSFKVLVLALREVGFIPLEATAVPSVRVLSEDSRIIIRMEMVKVKEPNANKCRLGHYWELKY